MYKRIVVKLGTSVLTGGTAHLDRAHMIELVRQCATLHEKGTEIILCSSGAIAAGREKMGFPKLEDSVSVRQMLAAVGQSGLMRTWEKFFEIYKIHVGQMLLTRADVQDRERFLNAHDAIHELIGNQVVPIVNENDAVATSEIKVGDNDNLSALVALLAEADLLILLTDQPGLFTADPRNNPDAQLIPEVRTIDETLRGLAGDSVSGLGIGGMATKLQAADVARRAGVDVVIAAGSAENVILKIANGEAVGTRFPALETPLDQRKRWIFAGPSPVGTLFVNAGAVDTLKQAGGSLLSVGIKAIEGSFVRGDTVVVKGPDGEEIARGIVRYDSNDLLKVKGLRSEEISDFLGYWYGPAVHCDDLILLIEDEHSWK
ncbi:MAG: glutamate 5-kinase [Rhodothermales bacterium]